MIQNKIFTNYSDWHRAYHKYTNFSAVEIDGILEPFENGEKEVFIYGKGWKKLGKKKIVDVPVITDTTDLNEFLNGYGYKCLYYALTSQLLGSQDCCWTYIQAEFMSMIRVGINDWMDVLNKFNNLKKDIINISLNKWGINPYDYNKMQTSKGGRLFFREGVFAPTLKHSIAGIIRCLPYLDAISDDDALYKTYYLCELNGDESLLSDDNLPISVKDRITYLYNENVTAQYENLMNPFKND